MRVTLNEARPIAQALTPTEGPGRFLVQIITPGWGSSGYYAQDVLEQAARDRIWPAGTHMYLDHPTESEQWERPERSVRDLAAVTMEDARWDEQRGALVAEAMVFSQWRRPLAEMLDAIGVSIRGSAEGDQGTVEGRTGRVFTRLVAGESIDFVTHAGRGGKVIAVIESGRANARAVARGVAEATANDRREQLDALIKDTYGGPDVWPWVRDFDDSTVWFEISGGDEGGIFQQTYAVTGDVATALTGTRTEVRVVTTYVPVDPAGQSTTTQESQEDTMPQTQIEESELSRLRADAGRVPTLESERAAAIERAEKAEATLAATETRTKLRPVVSQVIDASETIPAVAKTDTIESVVAALPADATEETAKEAATAARTKAETYAAQIAEAFGVGTPRGLGGTPTKPGAGEVTDAQVDEAAARAFGRKPTKEA